ncbi:Unknown protein, partial [Striga hermonthica]
LDLCLARVALRPALIVRRAQCPRLAHRSMRARPSAPTPLARRPPNNLPLRTTSPRASTPMCVCAPLPNAPLVKYFIMSVSDYVDLSNTQMPPRTEPGHQELPQATVVAHFRDYHPEKFFGQGDPRIVDEWVQGLEMIFEVMDCPDHYRVICAQIQLTGDARLWWNAHWGMRPGEKENFTWDQFKELICGKYYPSYYRADMERQFLALRQGTRSVDEYEREFTRLESFVSDLV